MDSSHHTCVPRALSFVYTFFLLLFLSYACRAHSSGSRRYPIPHFPNYAATKNYLGNDTGGASGPAPPDGRGGRGGEFPPYSWKALYFQQTLDHFSYRPAGYQKFPQKFLINSDTWGGGRYGSPIFVYFGNEGPIEWFARNNGFIWELASMFHGLLIFAEHRYYGESVPFGSRAAAYRDADSLAYLTAEQAMADMAALLTSLKANLSAPTSPVIVVGGSYGGMLAAWFRLKYPHIALAALASSAPILQFSGLVPPDTFNRIVSDDFKRENQSCYDHILVSWWAIDALAAADGGLAALSKQFRLCRPLQRTSDLKAWLYSAYSYLAMVDYPVAASFLMPLPAHPIAEVCKRIEDPPDNSTSLLGRIFAGVSLYYNYTGAAGDCFEISADPHRMSGWEYQACTEMVMPMSSRANTSMFEPYEWDEGAYADGCNATFGIRPRPRWATTEFGGRAIMDVLQNFGSNIIFSNGLRDPWSGGGVLVDISDSIVALVTTDGAHHLDLRAGTPEDPASVVKQRHKEIAYIRRWLSDYYELHIVPCGVACSGGENKTSIESRVTIAVAVLLGIIGAALAVVVLRERLGKGCRPGGEEGPGLRALLLGNEV